ncbi:tail protein [Ralstonia phage RPSC1]|uniref:Putative tail tubular protein A n=1 Tax=Ralstonia phage RPSC1 TaxID=2041351 RepID=A0A2Z2UBU7_9CAUD|nr:tail protein [Ralstonia phage RPSC1]ATN92932.1 putative tail tubular protein A [Ralstonia phage RPSC1]
MGEAPVNTLEGDGNVDAMSARALLAAVSAEKQDRGWVFNVDEDFQMMPDVFSQQVVWSPSYLRIITPSGTPYVNREGFVYDRLARTDRFPGPFTVTMTEEVPFEQLPFCFRQWITYVAAKRFNANNYGDPGIDAELSQRITTAEQAVQEFDIDYGGYNMFTSDPFYLSQSARS